MEAKPWSYSSLSTFIQCAYKYYRTQVTKDAKERPSPEMQRGTEDHKSFEDYVSKGTPLPLHLKPHQEFVDRMNSNLLPGERVEVERKVALNKKLQPTGFFTADVWWRGILDWTRYTPLHFPDKPDRLRAKIVDYKTGKYKEDNKQNTLGSLYLFREGVDLVDSRYYWTQGKQEKPRLILGKEEQKEQWARFEPDLRQYYTAFKEDIWQKRPSALCGWCPVKDCEHWRKR